MAHMKSPEFQTLLARIRQNVEAFLVDSDVRHLDDNKVAWARLRALGLNQEASEILQEEGEAEMRQAVAALN